LLDPRQVRLAKMKQAQQLVKEIRALDLVIPLLEDEPQAQKPDSDPDPLSDL
jgi:hypothetical protein